MLAMKKKISRQLMNTIRAHCLYYFSEPRAVCAFYPYIFLGKDFLSRVSMYFPHCCTTVLLSCDVLFSASSVDSLRFSLQKFYLKSQCVFDLPVYKVWLFKHVLVTKEVMAHAGRHWATVSESVTKFLSLSCECIYFCLNLHFFFPLPNKHK